MMLSMSTAIIAILNIIFVGLLPRIFFRQDGTFNLKWILTAAPYILSPIFLLFNTKEIAIWEPFVFGFNSERLILESLAMPIFALSIALIAFTIGIHRVPLALWHQENDAPKNIVTHGSYAWVRHPRSEEHTSELQSRRNLVCRLLLEKKKIQQQPQSCHLYHCSLTYTNDH